ncbi:MAG: ORF6N domain-containing protein [Candidatus Margulisbacteria bacterium]|nr:ORF6N domain-containing protein [Candidatus Margulisiibacteriota bacterium]MBU1022418.1 ORF6N domain-containing protein [Candidatus Margulisiibacteriota bacterium]MBU1729030.1 ORF6N domain-containing protein [Candidatus Margulisiibacteriota bacterium]MBU1954549.1 ORF6N domain-containing protein [Candidatus Margulisiibacteriota bacterium]
MINLIPIERIENKIYLIRGHKVMIDADLANLYGVKTFVLNQAVKRNIERFPKDFMFQLTKQEVEILKSQIVISSWGGRRTLPFAFTEPGIAMLSSVLRSKKAIRVNIAIMRVFIRLKNILSTHHKLAEKLNQLEQKYEKHDGEIQTVFKLIKKLLSPPKDKPKKIGFLR